MFSPLMLMIQEQQGDRLLDGAYWSSTHSMDDVFVVIECTDQRAQNIQKALESIGNQKMKRKIRTRTTKNPPGESWQHTVEGEVYASSQVAEH